MCSVIRKRLSKELCAMCLLQILAGSLMYGQVIEQLDGMPHGTSARAIALGNAYVSETYDAMTMYWNPAALAYLQQYSVVSNLAMETSSQVFSHDLAFPVYVTNSNALAVVVQGSYYGQRWSAPYVAFHSLDFGFAQKVSSTVSFGILINNNFLIGFPTGPDGDIWNWQFSWWAYKNIKLSYKGSFRRQGEGRIDTPWSRPWLSVDNYYEAFPTGTVEKQIVNGLNILAFDKNQLWGNMTLNYSDISNVGNVPGKDKNGWEIAIDIGYELPHLSWGF